MDLVKIGYKKSHLNPFVFVLVVCHPSSAHNDVISVLCLYTFVLQI